MSENETLVLEIISEKNKIKMSVFERREAVPLRHYSESMLSEREINSLCSEVTQILSKVDISGKFKDFPLSNELKKTGQLLYDQLLTHQVKEILQKTSIENLIISIDERLVKIPWELLFDGENFLCLKFNTGRNVRTKQVYRNLQYRSPTKPFKMLILADPSGDLDLAYKEGVLIRDDLGKRKDVAHINLKSTEITTNYIKKNIRDYDLIHYAGHSDYNFEDPSLSGWILKDGKLTSQDIVNMAGSLPMPLLVFSNACQSGTTQAWEIEKGYEDRVYGLANAFLLAGVKYYVGTFWKVLDEASLLFGKEFYKHLFSGESIGKSIRLTRLFLVDKYGKDSIVWASYVLYGDPASGLYSYKKHSVLKNRIKKLYVKASVGLLIIFSIAILFFANRSSIFSSDIPTATILPFKNLANGEEDWGISQSISDKLTGISSLSIIDLPTLIKQSDWKKLSKKDICKMTGIKFLIQGEYRKIDEQIALTVRLINSQSGEKLKVWEGTGNSNMLLAKDAANSIASMLGVYLEDKDVKKIEALPTTNPKAFELFSKTWGLCLDGKHEEVISVCNEVLNLDPEYLDAYKMMGQNYEYLGKTDKALKKYIEYLSRGAERKDEPIIAEANIRIAWMLHLNGEFEEAHDYYMRGIRTSKNAGNKLIEAGGLRQLAVLYIDKAALFYKKGEHNKESELYDKALEFLSKSAKINKQKKDNYMHMYNLACDYFDMALAYSNKDEYKKTFDYYNKSLEIFEKIGSKGGVVDCRVNMGEIYADIGEYKKALENYKISAGLYEEMKNLPDLGLVYNMIGEFYLERGDLKSAEDNFKKSLDIRKQVNQKIYLAETYENLGCLYEKKENYSESIQMFGEALVNYKNINRLDRASFLKKKIEELKKKIGK